MNMNENINGVLISRISRMEPVGILAYYMSCSSAGASPGTMSESPHQILLASANHDAMRRGVACRRNFSGHKIFLSLLPRETNNKLYNSKHKPQQGPKLLFCSSAPLSNFFHSPTVLPFSSSFNFSSNQGTIYFFRFLLHRPSFNPTVS